MATHYADHDADTGLTLTVELFALGSDTVVYTASATAAQTNRIGTYRSTFTDVAAGTYELRSRVSSSIKGTWYVRFAGTDTEVVTGTTNSIPTVADIASAVWNAGTRTITGLTQAALALFATQDTGQTSAAAGSVAKLAQGGASAVTVYPLQTTINDRVQATTIQAYVGEAGYAIGPNAVVDGNGDPVDLTAATTLRFIVTDKYGTQILNTASVTISGTDSNYWTVTGTSDTTLTAPTEHEWSLRDVTTGVNVVYGLGTLKVTPAANVSA